MTKIISDDNKSDFLHQQTFLQKDEQPLLCFKQNESTWLLITTGRIIEERNGATLLIPYSDLVKVDIALYEEYKDGIMNTMDFTRLILIDIHGRNHIIKLEKGEPYKGIFQILHYVILNINRP